MLTGVMYMTNEEYGELLRSIRKTAGLTQKEVGMACGYDEINADRMVRGWEAGKSLPTLMRLRALAKALHCSLDKIIP